MRLRRAILKNPAKSSVSLELPFHNSCPLLTHSESTLLQLLIPLHFNSRRINTYKKPGGGSPTSAPDVLQLVNPSLFVIPSEARNLIFPSSSLSHYPVTSLHPVPAALRAHSNARNPISFMSLLHGSLYTRGVGPHPSPRPTRPSLLASIPFRITFFAHPHRLTLSESYSCKKHRGMGIGSRITGHESPLKTHRLRSRYISRNLQGRSTSQRRPARSIHDRRRSSGAAAIPRRRSSSA
jgi:hypothetical protein